MKIGIRILCVLILIYNLYFAFGSILTAIMRGVGVGGHWLEAYPNTRTLVLLVTGALFMFLFAHSIRLIMFFDFSRKLQFWLSALYPVFRIPYSLLVIFNFPTHIRLLVMLLIAATAVDAGIAFAMRSSTTCRIFKETEERRSAKYWAKKNNFTTI